MSLMIPKATKPQAEPEAPRVFWTPVEAIEIKPSLSGHKFHGFLQVGKSRRVMRPKRYVLDFDNIWDLKELCERICLDVGGRLFLRRAQRVRPEKLELEAVLAGPITVSPVTVPPDFEGGFYLGLETPDGDCFHNYFVHLEDLIQLLHRVVIDAQGFKRRTAAGAVAAVFHDQRERATLH
jgi:hypothetical protein